MICAHCREAGEYNKFVTGEYPWYPDARPDFEAQAASFHARCPGGTYCDCQHFVGVGMLREDKQ